MRWWHWVGDGLNVAVMGLLAWQATKWKLRALKAQIATQEMVMVAGHLCGFDRGRFIEACEKRQAELMPKPARQN